MKESSTLDEITLSEGWVHSSIPLNKSLFTCPICFQFILEPVECLECGRLFCKEDYSNYCEEKSNCACPLCKSSPWEITDKIHVSYKNMLEGMKYKCGICPEKNLVLKELVTHLKNDHGKKIKGEEKEIYEYAVESTDKTMVKQLDFYQNLQINYKRINKKKFYILDPQDEYLSINIKKGTFRSAKLSGELKEKQTDAFEREKSYRVWAFEGHYDHEQFYLEEHQKILESGYQKYLKNKKLFEIHLDIEGKEEIRYRVNFKNMTQANINTDFERNISRMEVKF